MGKMPQVKTTAIIDVICGYGYVLDRCSGDHKIYKHKDFPMFKVVIYAKRDVVENIARQIYSQLALIDEITGEDRSKIFDNYEKIGEHKEIIRQHRNWGPYLYEVLKSFRDENGNAYDCQEQYEKFINQQREIWVDKKFEEIKKKEGIAAAREFADKQKQIDVSRGKTKCL